MRAVSRWFCRHPCRAGAGPDAAGKDLKSWAVALSCGSSPPGAPPFHPPRRSHRPCLWNTCPSCLCRHCRSRLKTRLRSTNCVSCAPPISSLLTCLKQAAKHWGPKCSPSRQRAGQSCAEPVAEETCRCDLSVRSMARHPSRQSWRLTCSCPCRTQAVRTRGPLRKVAQAASTEPAARSRVPCLCRGWRE